MWLDFERRGMPDLKKPALIVAVSTSMQQYKALYSQAREVGEYLLRNMEFKHVATIRSSAFPPEVIVRDGGMCSLPECRLSISHGPRDVVLFTGDSSPMDAQYEFANVLLDYAAEMGIKELFSLGARWAENPLAPETEPEPNGFATDRIGVSNLKRHGVRIIPEEPAPFFASMIVGMAKERGIRGYKISVDHGEPSPHPRSVARLIGVLSGMIGFEVPQEERGEEPNKPQGPQKETRDHSIYR